MSALHDLSVVQLATQLRAKDISAVETAQHFLARIKAHESLGTFLAIDEEVTLRQARAADARIAAGDSTPLLGVPVAHKDIFVTKDFVSTAGSRMLAASTKREGYCSPFDSTVVSQLANQGVVTLGKLNCDEFAMGSSNENSAVAPVGHAAPYPVKNPWDVTRIPGGSSGGSAAAVAARLTPAATGTDTGGSIRQPASFCGITGIKPTYGRASRYGMIAFASSLDQAGPMARTAEDCAILLSAMCGPDLDRDSTSLDRSAEDYSLTLNDSIRGLRIGVPKEWFDLRESGSGQITALHPMPELVVGTAIEAALSKFRELGAIVVPVSLPLTELSIPVYYVIAAAEASSNLSRFDGVKFGHRAEKYSDLADMYKKTRAEGFGDEVKRRIMIGAYVLSHGYYDAYYLQAQKIRRMISNDFQRVFTECDVIAGPVAPTIAWKLGEHSGDPLANYLADIYTLPASLAGLPCMSIPAHVMYASEINQDGDNCPIGLQLIGNYFSESKLLNVAHQYQQVTNWHTLKPAGI